MTGKVLSDITSDAIRIQGLCDALSELRDSDTPQAFQGVGALIATLQDFASQLVSDLENHEKHSVSGEDFCSAIDRVRSLTDAQKNEVIRQLRWEA